VGVLDVCRDVLDFLGRAALPHACVPDRLMIKREGKGKKEGRRTTGTYPWIRHHRSEDEAG